MGTVAKFDRKTSRALMQQHDLEPERLELTRTERVLIMQLTIPVGGRTTPECHLYTRKKIMVVEGCAAINLPTGAQRLLENEDTQVEAGTFHCIENHGKIPLIALEIRTGVTEVDDAYGNVSDFG